MARSPALSRGQIWWARLRGPAKTRPVVLVSREDSYERRELFIVAPVTRRIRGIRSEVLVGATEGLAADSAVNCDTLRTADRSVLMEMVGTLDVRRLEELDLALKFALGIE